MIIAGHRSLFKFRLRHDLYRIFYVSLKIYTHLLRTRQAIPFIDSAICVHADKASFATLRFFLFKNAVLREEGPLSLRRK